MATEDWTPVKGDLLARGGTALIFRSRDDAGNPAALKVSRGAEFDRVVSREGEFANLPEHPARLRVIGRGTDDRGRAWVLLPLLAGATLGEWRGGARSLVQALSPAADLLDTLHRHNYGHADLKPTNLLRSGEIFLVSDLGLATPLGEVAPGGSPAYLSPSRLARAPLRWQDDLHSFAVLVFESLTGQLPFKRTTGEPLLADIRAGALNPLSLLRPDLPRQLERLFHETLRGGSDAGSVLLWLDQLGGIVGVKPPPRSLFLSGDTAGMLKIDPAAWSGDRLPAMVSELLSSISCSRPQLPREERIVLRELIGNRPRRLPRILEYLLQEHLIQEDAGWISFTTPPRRWRRHLMTTLSREERGDRGGVSGGAAVDDPPRGAAELATAWGERTDATEGLELIREAIAGGEIGWVADLPWGSWLELAEFGSREIQEQLLSPGYLAPLPGEIVTRLRIFPLVRYLRKGDPEGAEELFWELEGDLGLECSAELSRRVTYQFLESGRIAPGFDHLKRWQRCRQDEVAGTVLEIRIAARELSALAFFGDLQAVEELAVRYQRQFAGRAGVWYLNMALANLATERSDSREVIHQTDLALNALREEGGAPATRVDLIYHLASELMLAGTVEGRSRVPQLLVEAESGARELDDPLLIQRVLSARGLWSMGRGHLAEAEGLFQQTLSSAEDTGQLDRSRYHRNNLALAVFYQGDYRRLQSLMTEMRATVTGSGALHEHLYTRTILTLFQIEFGDLAGVAREIGQIMPAAREARSQRIQGLLHLRQALMLHYGGDDGEAVGEMERALEFHRLGGNVEETLRCRLWLLRLQGGGGGIGKLYEIIQALEQLEAPRYLPGAWSLLAARLIATSQMKGAGEALAGGFDVARRLGNPENLWPLHLQAAELAAAEGDLQRGVREAGRAVEVLRDLSLCFDGAERDLFLARVDRQGVLTRLRQFRSATGR